MDDAMNTRRMNELNDAYKALRAARDAQFDVSSDAEGAAYEASLIREARITRLISIVKATYKARKAGRRAA